MIYQNDDDNISVELLSMNINKRMSDITSGDDKYIINTFYKWVDIGKMSTKLKQMIISQNILWESWCMEHFEGAGMNRIREAMKIYEFTKRLHHDEIDYMAELGFDNSLEVIRALDKVQDINNRKLIMEQNAKAEGLFLKDDREKKVEMGKWLIEMSKVAEAVDLSTINIAIVHSVIIANGSISDNSIKKIAELTSKPDELQLYCKKLIINGGDDNSDESGSNKYSLNVSNAIFHNTVKEHKEQTIPVNDFLLNKLSDTNNSLANLLASAIQKEVNNAA